MKKNDIFTLFHYLKLSRYGHFFLIICLLTCITSTNVTAKNSLSGFNKIVLNVIKKMPKGGNYSTDSIAHENLSKKAVQWNESHKTLLITPDLAQPSFCSEACYLVLLQSLQECEKIWQKRFSPEFWQYMAIEEIHPDGFRGWGRVNANGHGLAKWIYELGAGYNFTDIHKAQPGDFMKIFWTEEIGAKERGHLTIYLALRPDKSGQKCVWFWSSNKGRGYSIKSVPITECHHFLFTHIHNPGMFSTFKKQPETDKRLQSLLNVSISQDEVNDESGIPPQKP